METVSTVGKGYYNYYNQSDRYSTTDGKALNAWYDLDLSKEEINSNNSGIKNRDSAGADVCRSVAEKFQGIAASNRSKYSSVDEMKNAVWAKYSLGDQYKHLSKEQKTALARTEIEMTMYGTVHEGDADIIAGIKGDIKKKKLGDSEEGKRTFNVQMLGKQIGNVFQNNGINQSLFGNRQFRFSVNGMTNKVSVELLNDSDDKDRTLLDEMEKALNTKDNAKQLFFNLLYDSNKKGVLAKDQLAKWKLFNDFQNITGLDIRDFKQTEDGFIDKDGKSARDIYKDSLATTKKVPAEFKGDAYDYFVQLEQDAMKYDINEVKDLELSLEYQNGMVQLPGAKTSFDMTI